MERSTVQSCLAAPVFATKSTCLSVDRFSLRWRYCRRIAGRLDRLVPATACDGRGIGLSTSSIASRYEIKVPAGFDHPMSMIVNFAMGSKDFKRVGVDRISAYQIDAYWSL
jgi:hypothetical protein